MRFQFTSRVLSAYRNDRGFGSQFFRSHFTPRAGDGRDSLWHGDGPSNAAVPNTNVSIKISRPGSPGK